ncbi:hypothetical protein MXD62_33125 [Frankia sp. Mgl5]|uniref:hypothetical protein n=1 Tax=Frankia sp. Mgl5 TaxID=2933793 RepID=UPI00200FA7A4|nr:hypothetical protein [Frankia sp. Mgl5]MCK9931923.1 hypothetical protein [Frankia sp. Mgl5]
MATETEDSFYFYLSDHPDLPKSVARHDDFRVHEDDFDDVVEELGVEWFGSEEGERLEREVFDLRREWAARRARRERLRKWFSHLHQ